MSDRLRAFRKERERLNERVLEKAPLGIKRFFALDERTYTDGALEARTKELLGLAASTVLAVEPPGGKPWSTATRTTRNSGKSTIN